MDYILAPLKAVLEIIKRNKPLCPDLKQERKRTYHFFVLDQKIKMADHKGAVIIDQKYTKNDRHVFVNYSAILR